jgi:protoporphyrinogen oxidase
MTPTIDIVGAGISGLATAWYLDRALPAGGARIRVWERDDQPGGLAGSFTTAGFSVEKFYHHLFRRDVALQELIAEVGLADDLVWRPALTGAYYFDQPYRLSSPLDLLRFRALPFADRVRLGLMVLRARTVRDWQALDDVSAMDWIRTVAGERVLRVVWEPLLHGKFGGHAPEVSAAWLWSKLVDRGGSRDRRGHELLGYLRGGLGRLFERMVDVLEARGHAVHLATPVAALHGDGEEIRAIETPAGALETDAVVLATQVPDLIALLPRSASEYAGELARIDFLANVCLVLELERSLSQFYWTNVTDPEAPFVGVIEQTRWADATDFSNRHVAYVSAYVTQDDPRLEMDAGELLESYLPWIRRMFPVFDRADIAAVHLWRARSAQPIVRVGFRELVPAITTPISNLFLCTMAQIYPQDRQVSNGVEIARRTARLVVERVSPAPSGCEADAASAPIGDRRT